MIKLDLTDKITDPLSCGANSLSFLYDDDTSTAYETKYQSASGNAQYGQPIDINLGKEMRAEVIVSRSSLCSSCSGIK